MESSAAVEGSAAVSQPGYPVQVEIPRPAKTSRLLLLVRFILIIPQLLFGLVITIVALVLAAINYFVVLITGRAAFAAFLSGAIRYGTRVNAYWYFLVDKYPPFSLGDAPDYPVTVTLARPGKIHRWRFFSYFLALPHFLILYGLTIVVSLTTFVSFFIVLVVGRYPPGLFGLAAGLMRYQARVAGYLYLVVDRYPPFSLS